MTMNGLPLGKNGTKSINKMIPTDGTAVNAVASQGTLTVDTQPIVGDTFTIGTKEYTFVTDETAAADGEVDVGADLADAKVQIVAAINGTDHNTASAFVTAAAFATNDCVLTAITAGVAGDSIATTETFERTINAIREEQYSVLTNKARRLVYQAMARLTSDIFTWHKDGMIEIIHTTEQSKEDVEHV